MTVLTGFIIACFACFRLAELVTVDDGPLDIFKRIRIAVGCYELGEDGRAKTNPGRLLSCPFCTGVWLAFFIALAVSPLDLHLILWWFAIAGGQALLQTVGGRI